MQIHLVTGKGGVGKSVVAAALAQKMASTGARTLLAELGDESFFADFLSLPKVGYQPVPTGLGPDVCLWSGESCLREYALYLLKIESLYKLFFENPVSRTLVEIAPALSELAIMGKVTSGPPRNVGPKLPYDVLVVDAFASGHFLALLKAPIGMQEAIRLGPMADQSRGILKTLRDPQLTHYHVVALPEELPVQESLELARDIEATVGQKSRLWLNKWQEFPTPLRADGPEYERDFARKAARQKDAREKLTSEFGNRLKVLPFLFEGDEKKMLTRLASEVQL